MGYNHHEISRSWSKIRPKQVCLNSDEKPSDKANRLRTNNVPNNKKVHIACATLNSESDEISEMSVSHEHSALRTQLLL